MSFAIASEGEGSQAYAVVELAKKQENQPKKKQQQNTVSVVNHIYAVLEAPGEGASTDTPTSENGDCDLEDPSLQPHIYDVVGNSNAKATATAAPKNGDLNSSFSANLRDCYQPSESDASSHKEDNLTNQTVSKTEISQTETILSHQVSKSNFAHPVYSAATEHTLCDVKSLVDTAPSKESIIHVRPPGESKVDTKFSGDCKVNAKLSGDIMVSSGDSTIISGDSSHMYSCLNTQQNSPQPKGSDSERLDGETAFVDKLSSSKFSCSKNKVILTLCFLLAGLVMCAMSVLIFLLFLDIAKLKEEIRNITLQTMDSQNVPFTAKTINCTPSCDVEEFCKDLENITQDFLNTTRNILEEVDHRTDFILETIDSLGQPSRPAASCSALLSFHPSSPSDYYWVRASNGSAVRVYCDMTLSSCGNVTGGWTRVAYLNITENSLKCLGNLELQINDDIRACRSLEPSVAVFSVNGLSYSSVCGRVKAYTGIFSPIGFHSGRNINEAYVDGISLTHGSLQHIWTFALTIDQRFNNCPCSFSDHTTTLNFVGSDYFCDTYSSGSTSLLWEGGNCDDNVCCMFNNPPWFYRLLAQSTTDDIKMRVFKNFSLEALEIYVQ